MPRLALGRSFGRSSMNADGGRGTNASPAVPPAALARVGADPSTNPWVEAVQQGRREWAGAFGDLARSRRNWQLVAFGALAVAGIASTGLVALATTTRITPYVVEVDRLGRPQAFGPATRVEPADQRVVVSQIATWIRDVRAVLADPVAQQDLVRHAYAFVDQNTADFLQSYFTDPARDPRVIARELTRVVEVTSILPVPGGAGSSAARGAAAPPTTWKVSWTETDYPRGGGTPTIAAWEAYVTTRQVPPTSSERVEVNPLGLYVTAVSWTQVSARQPAIQTATEPVRAAAAAPLPTITSAPLVSPPEGAAATGNAPTGAPPASDERTPAPANPARAITPRSPPIQE